MVSLFFIIFFAATIFFIVKYIKEYKSKIRDEEVCLDYLLLALLFGIISMLLFYRVSELIDRLGTGYTIDIKIAMYEEENTSIEETIQVTVRSYMDFEASTYGELKDKDITYLVSLFPELKSDTLVQKQIEIYVENKNKIKKLKEEKINLAKSKWQLYFGR